MNNKKLLIKNLSLALILTACSSNTAPPPANDPDADMANWIGSNITGDERREIAKVLRLLPVEQRENVVLAELTTERTFANRTNLRSGLVAYQPPSQGIAVASAETDGLSPTATTPPTCTTGRTGAMRRWLSAPTSATYMGALIKLPVSTDVFGYEGYSGYPTEDTPYLYFGGWGEAYTNAQGYNSKGRNMDVGLKYNSYVNSNGDIQDDWSPFLKTEKKSVIIRGQSRRIAYDPGAEITMQMQMVGQGYDKQYVILFTKGINNGSEDSLTLAVEIKPENGLEGWRLPMQNFRFKRVTSIAQNRDAVSVNREYEPTYSFLNNVEWTNIRIGESGTNNQLYNYYHHHSVCDVPNDSRIIKTPPGAGLYASEKVSIYLYDPMRPYSLGHKK